MGRKDTHRVQKTLLGASIKDCEHDLCQAL